MSDSDSTIRLLKFVRPDLTPTNGSARATGHVWVPGAWAPPIPDPIPCERGYHGIEDAHLIDWVGEVFDVELWRAEARGQIECHGAPGDYPKLACAEMRLVARVEAWNASTLRLFAADCAERVLPRFERERPNDPRPRQAIETARRFARGEATQGERTAAEAAARAAARAAAEAAAEAAAKAAARAAARVAARAAAEAAEQRWQNDHLLTLLGLAEAPS